MRTPEQRIEAGEIVRFVYHEWSNRKPVDLFMAKHNAVGQQELPLHDVGLMSVWKQSSDHDPLGGSTTGEKE